MATRGPANIYSGEIMPVAPKIDDPELAAFVRNLLDYLRRLTGKLARFSTGAGNGSVLMFIAHLDGTFTAATPEDTIPWRTVLRQDSPFTVNGAFTEITVSTDGTYVVEVDLTLNKNFPFTIIVKVNGTTPVYANSYVLTPDVGGTYSFMIPLELAADDVITVVLYINDMLSLGEALQSGSRLVITKIGDEA